MRDFAGDPDALLAGRYAIEHEIGRGGMATVYRGRDVRHGSVVAVKVLHPELATMVGSARFQREIRITARLQHPGILPVLDSGESDGLPFFVMPLVEGETLQQRLERDRQLPIAEALQYAIEIADALAHAHEQGFVHRDVKPSNVLLSHGHAVLTDFGIAQIVSDTQATRLTETGLTLGTAAYMSPEQSSAERVDHRSDIYSLGCVLYEMLAGTPPFVGSSAQSVMARHAVDPVPSVRTVRQGASPELQAVIERALAKSPADRFQGAAEVRDALTGVQAGSLTARASTATEVQRRAHGRRRGVVAGALVTAGVVAAAVVFLRAGRGPSEETGLDAGRIMVFPLITSVATVAGTSSVVGEDVATLIGNALDGAGSLRWIDAWPLLEPAHRENIRLLPAGGAEALARAKRCAFFVTGRLVARGDSTDVILELRDVAGDSVVAGARASALPAEAWRAGLAAANILLPKLIPAGAPDLASGWSTRPPAAVVSFLLGEAAFRRTRTGEALRHFRDAVRQDSTFALAAIRGAQAATWSHRASEATALVDVAFAGDLPPHLGAYARGYRAYLRGEGDSALVYFRAVIGSHPEMAAAWMQLGETYTHLLPRAGRVDSLAEFAFEEARAIDSAATNTLLHLIEARLRRGEGARAEPLVREFLASAPDTMLARQVEVMARCVRDGAGALPWDSLAAQYPLPLLLAAGSLSAGVSQPACGGAAYEALLRTDTTALASEGGRPFFAMQGLHLLRLAQGLPDEAMATTERHLQRWRSGNSIYLLTAPYAPALAERARAVAAEDRRAFGDDLAKSPYALRLWFNGIWAAHEGEPDRVASIARELRRRQRAGGEGAAGIERQLRSLAAFEALARGDSAGAFERLDRLVPAVAPSEELKWEEGAAMGGERLALAQLLLRRGRAAEALAVASVFDSSWPAIHLVYLPASLAVRAEAAAVLQDAALEGRFRSRLAELRSAGQVSTR